MSILPWTHLWLCALSLFVLSVPVQQRIVLANDSGELFGDVLLLYLSKLFCTFRSSEDRYRIRLFCAIVNRALNTSKHKIKIFGEIGDSEEAWSM